MTVYGFHASHEQISPRQLLADVRLAEQAGFEAAMCSDHLEPWSQRQGHAGMAWPWLGAALATTSLSIGTVTAPGQRYHPAIVAQAIATLGQMFPGRFWTALGTGQFANEHVTGQGWPRKEIRQQRLEECVGIIARLLDGETVSHDGLVTVEEATIWETPSPRPALIAPAISVETAERGARWADGLATINQDPAHLKEMLARWTDAGGAPRRILQVHLSWAPTQAEALALAHDQWRSNVLPSPASTDLRVATYDAVTERGVGDEQLREAVLVSADLGELTERIHELADLGFDELYLHHVGQEQRPFLEAFGESVLPRLRSA
ncbi:TIGR03885 family FMN-dependent LLM class oxidoreductase [Brachybacterium paraconglomeratum]|uniref:TIGR03885 family FMN-dependent LLM class oxidoreductase n=1 Tax=Brachybacterium paraconglomeratum TaxID=173362 RepID=UPI0021A650CD|nr:TIGR03885 family FMN-dependent LLM class oxidoreductase [Brachybacterium paraconglomeratum]MCT1909142.1 TIGR03885 family FMN-dependent LLM class oxidoreductase [Brachybacterium paraconglomeratum]